MAAIHGKNYGEPTLDLNFAGNKSLVDTTTEKNYVTFSRAQSGNEATYIGSDGLIKYAAADEARFDHDPATLESLGLLIEESRTNLITDSSSANNWNTLGGGTTAVSTSICPDGSTDGTRVTAVALNDGASKPFSVPTSGIHKGTYYARTRTGVSVDVKVAISGLTGPKVTLPADGTWVRVEGSLNNLGAGSKYLSIRSDNASMDIDVWGLQAELGSFPTSIIPTTSSTVTRAADLASISGTSFSDFYNSTEGTLLSFSRTLGVDLYATATFELTSSNSNAERIALDVTNSYNRFEVYGGGDSGTNNIYSVVPAGTLTKNALAYKLNDVAAVRDGGTVLNDASVGIPIPNIDRANIGHNLIYGEQKQQHISRLTYYPKRLPDIELQQLTK